MMNHWPLSSVISLSNRVTIIKCCPISERAPPVASLNTIMDTTKITSITKCLLGKAIITMLKVVTASRLWGLLKPANAPITQSKTQWGAKAAVAVTWKEDLYSTPNTRQRRTLLLRRLEDGTQRLRWAPMNGPRFKSFARKYPKPPNPTMLWGHLR